MASAARSARPWSLNALSGIGGVQTHRCPGGFGAVHLCVLMPCRALEAFRLLCQEAVRQGVLCVLMPCRALEAFRLLFPHRVAVAVGLRLNALSGIGGVQTKF